MSYGDTDCSVCVCVCMCVSMPLYQLGLFSADTDAHNITRPFSRFPSLSLSLSLSSGARSLSPGSLLYPVSPPLLCTCSSPPALLSSDSEQRSVLVK